MSFAMYFCESASSGVRPVTKCYHQDCDTACSGKYHISIIKRPAIYPTGNIINLLGSRESLPELDGGIVRSPVLSLISSSVSLNICKHRPVRKLMHYFHRDSQGYGAIDQSK